MEVIHWCLDLGVPEISVYAFSIANFQRTKQEVDGLMNLSEVKYQEMMQVSSFAGEFTDRRSAHSILIKLCVFNIKFSVQKIFDIWLVLVVGFLISGLVMFKHCNMSTY